MITVKIALIEGTISHPAFEKFRKRDIPGRLSLFLARVFHYASGKMKPYFEEKQKLIEKYGEKDENGQLKTVDSGDGQTSVRFESIDKQIEFIKELSILQNEEITLDVNKIDLDKELDEVAMEIESLQAEGMPEEEFEGEDFEMEDEGEEMPEEEE